MSMKERDNPNNPLGVNNADNAYSSSSVAANADGSILERLEALKDNIGTADGYFDVPSADSAANTTMRDVIGNKTDTVGGNSVIALLKQILTDTGTTLDDLIDTEVADILTEVNKIETPSNACKRQAGKNQIATVNITEAANAGVTTKFTVTSQSVMIKRVVLMSNGATTADLTSAAIEGGASQVVQFIDAATAVKASIDAVDEQLSASGAWVLNAADTITVDLQGTGATAVDLTLVIEYAAIVDGGYLA